MSDARAPRDRESALREQGLQLVTRFVATLRTGRSYAIGNLAFTRQLEQLLEALAPVLAEHGAAVIVAVDGDLHVNGVRLPLRSSSLRSLEQMAQEFSVREIAGVEFRAGLALAELEGFMRYFLPSELYKGSELSHACATQDFQHALPVEAVAPEIPAAEAEPAGEPAERSFARHAVERALQNTQLLLGDGAWRRGIELRHLKRVAQPLVDAGGSELPATTVLAGAVRPGANAREHAVHVCVLAVAIGRRLGMPRAGLAELGVAALLHDAGKPAVAARVRHPLAARGPAERAEAESHAIEGLRAIALSTSLDDTAVAAMRAALEHHAGGPDGYPPLSPAWEPAVVSRIVAIADAYISLLEWREDGREPLAPAEALGRVLGPLAPRFHPGLRAALVRVLGVHPPGQVVELDDGSRVRSLGCAPESPERPYVEWLAAPAGAALPAAGPLPPERSVRRALPLAEWPAAARAA